MISTSAPSPQPPTPASDAELENAWHPPQRGRTAVLLSGGVDSSVALHLLAAEHRERLTAFYLKIWLEDEVAFLGDCPWEDDLAFARQVCADAGVPLEVIPLQREYRQRIVAYSLDELRAGRTPSSDVLCNQQIKFGAFLDAVGPEVSAVASGHYARRIVTGEQEDRALLARSPDPVKDQTYFLARLSREQVQHCRFPIGHLYKYQVRRLAEDLALPNRHRPDSQGICFLGKIPFREFIRHHLGERPGEIRHAETGERLGEHRGHWFHTLGQRKGLGLSGGPWYVVGKNSEENLLLVSHRERLQQWAPESFEVEALHWLGEPLPLPAGSLDESSALRVRLRHGGALLPFRLETSEPNRARVFLGQGDPGIAPGQFAVFYEENICIGCGIISNTQSTDSP